MAGVQILTPEQVQTGGTIRLVARATTDAGAPDPARTLTFALYNPASGLWWDHVGLEWVAARTENALPAVADFDGLYLRALSHVDLSPGTAEADWLVEITSDAAGTPTAARAFFLRDAAAAAPVADGAVADPPETVGEVLQALRVFLTHKQVIDDATKRLVFYREDGETVAMSFDLKDAAGAASVREPFQRIRAE